MLLKNEKVTCDECHHLFKIKPKTKTYQVSIKETYFHCPKCKKKYIGVVTDHECRKLQREIKSIRKSKNDVASRLVNGEITDDEYEVEIDKIDNTIKDKQKIMKHKMDALKERMQKELA